MKKKTLLFVFLIGIMTANCFAQECPDKNVPTATVCYEPQLLENENYFICGLWETPNDIYDCFVTDNCKIEAIEHEMLGKHAALMSMEFKNFVNSDDAKIMNDGNIKELILSGKGELYNNEVYEHVVVGWNSIKEYYVCPAKGNSLFYHNFYPHFPNIKKSIRYEIAKNKEFRDAIFDRVSDFVCDLIKVLPKDFGIYIEKVLMRINEDVIDIGNDIANHKYELKSYIYEGNTYRGQKWFYLERDGIALDALYGGDDTPMLDDWWLRRIFIDKIPYDEIKSRIAELIVRVQNVDISKNADVLTIHKLAKGLLYCIGRDSRYLYSCATHQEYSMFHYEYVPAILQKVTENGKTVLRISKSEHLDSSTADQEYSKMGFSRKEETYKFDEEGNLIQLNVEYK